MHDRDATTPYNLPQSKEPPRIQLASHVQAMRHDAVRLELGDEMLFPRKQKRGLELEIRIRFRECCVLDEESLRAAGPQALRQPKDASLRTGLSGDRRA